MQHWLLRASMGLHLEKALKKAIYGSHKEKKTRRNRPCTLLSYRANSFSKIFLYKAQDRIVEKFIFAPITSSHFLSIEGSLAREVREALEAAYLVPAISGTSSAGTMALANSSPQPFCLLFSSHLYRL